MGHIRVFLCKELTKEEREVYVCKVSTQGEWEVLYLCKEMTKGREEILYLCKELTEGEWEVPTGVSYERRGKYTYVRCRPKASGKYYTYVRR